jgi:hypothetical protein
LYAELQRAANSRGESLWVAAFGEKELAYEDGLLGHCNVGSWILDTNFDEQAEAACCKVEGR